VLPVLLVTNMATVLKVIIALTVGLVLTAILMPLLGPVGAFLGGMVFLAIMRIPVGKRR